jgi:hypothetical protein
MKYFSLILVLFAFVSCQQAQQPAGKTGENAAQLPSTGNFGKEVAVDKSYQATELAGLFSNTDKIECNLSGQITASCKHTGCWMDLDMGNGETVHVTFLDESFTIPLDAAGKKAIAQGTATRELIPVEKLKNYAREDGKSEAEIAAITKPQYAYEFVASGVLIEE